MTKFQHFVAKKLSDRKICDAEVPAIRERLYADGQLNLDDVKLLIELYCEADKRCPAFEKLFFSVLEEVLLEDGEVQPAEQFYLLKMLYSDRKICKAEREFLQSVRDRAAVRTPEFEALCQTALAAGPSNWSVGGCGR
jgi:hypothetical protein